MGGTIYIRPGRQTEITYNCGHVFVSCTNPILSDPAGLYCMEHDKISPNELCYDCRKRVDRDEPEVLYP